MFTLEMLNAVAPADRLVEIGMSRRDFHHYLGLLQFPPPADSLSQPAYFNDAPVIVEADLDPGVVRVQQTHRSRYAPLEPYR